MNYSKISIFVAILININIMVGAAIYIGPPQMAEVAGTYSYLGWLLCAAVFLPVVISINWLSHIYPGESGLYSYVRKTFGSSLGFLCGWFYFVAFTGAEALQSVVIVEAAAKFSGWYFLLKYSWLVKVVMFSFIFLLCQFSIAKLGKLQASLTIVKLVPILFVLLTLLLLPFIDLNSASASSSAASQAQPFLFTNIIKTIPFAIFGFWGFEASCNLGDKIKGGRNQASRALLISFFCRLVYICLISSATTTGNGSRRVDTR